MEQLERRRQRETLYYGKGGGLLKRKEFRVKQKTKLDRQSVEDEKGKGISLIPYEEALGLKEKETRRKA